MKIKRKYSTQYSEERSEKKGKRIYEKYIKRSLDFIASLIAVVVLSPVLLVLIVTGTVAMRGNPFFIQKRPGKDEKIFKLIKFRTMTNKRDEKGNLLADENRLTAYGRFLRKTSLDELPELFNILSGSLAICGPRPLLVEYLPRYSSEQRRRHNVRPGLTGYAQAYGRNSLTWQEKFEKDIYYVDHISLWLDIKIIFKTISVVLRGEGISSETSATMEEFIGNGNDK